MATDITKPISAHIGNIKYCDIYYIGVDTSPIYIWLTTDID